MCYGATMEVGRIDEARREGWVYMRKGLFGHERVLLRVNGERLAAVKSESGAETWELETAKCRLYQGWGSEIVVKEHSRTFAFKVDGERENFQAWWRAIEAAVCPKLKKFYNADGVLGEGRTAVVRSACDKAVGQRVALKMIKRITNCVDDPALRYFLSEVRITRAAEGENVIKLFDAFNTKSYFVLVLEKCNSRGLLDVVRDDGPLCENKAQIVMRQLLQATSRLHAKGIAHRDLKLDNILFAGEVGDLQVKLADFGSAALGKSDPCDTNFSQFNEHVGTEAYMAPEMWRKQRYGMQVDTFSLGVIMFALLSGYFPASRHATPDVDTRPNFREDEWDNVSESAKSLIRQLLHSNPMTRLATFAALRHPWFDVLRPESENIKSEGSPRLSLRSVALACMAANIISKLVQNPSGQTFA
eukprot:Plantae.Rhodophyta-Purpureofilum_apyrenoidigerum.ctg1348.p1 GENE.Plantae.Rhodophyta-Purpureofilum_apyrenoidigerum.ctg1348~~Plantae.Rhodophyta-Purpureofilum_apyrenoidigerum.ctg1348.p1  ORF type:complete len:417 (-),score=69.82 Plantae.Rhodophyta-Purpureofilum_apyrenoidigerum.ctg1348:50-1300(-)